MRSISSVSSKRSVRSIGSSASLRSSHAATHRSDATDATHAPYAMTLAHDGRPLVVTTNAEIADDPQAGARETLADAQPSLPQEGLGESAGALLAATTEPSRRCTNCDKPLTGRSTKRMCSGRCRAAWSRRQQQEAK